MCMYCVNPAQLAFHSSIRHYLGRSCLHPLYCFCDQWWLYHLFDRLVITSGLLETYVSRRVSYLWANKLFKCFTLRGTCIRPTAWALGYNRLISSSHRNCLGCRLIQYWERFRSLGLINYEGVCHATQRLFVVTGRSRINSCDFNSWVILMDVVFICSLWLTITLG